MGIKGIYPEIGPGRRVALSKLAADTFERTGRPLRIAVDVSIWLFQIQASKGGTNPALRTFYYRLLRLIALSIHPIFVFDGPNKPPFKRNKKTGGPAQHVATIPEFLAKQLLRQFGFPLHLAPGEAEAECALLQREGIVDAVLSEDVDTLMFGSGLTFRNWSPEQRSSKTPTHVNVYDAAETKNGPSGLDRDGMILVALMSGGDYVPEGIPGCGPKRACEAARAGFGKDLCRLAGGDTEGLLQWRDRLQHEIKTNESKFFAQKRPSLIIPDDFPRVDILRYYTHPAISNQASLDRLRRSINWDQDLDFAGLRGFTHDAFDWVKLEGAKHFIRSLAPSLLIRQLRMRGERTERLSSNHLPAVQEDEALLVKGIHGKRQHAVTDGSTELRVSFTPIDLVRIDLSTEEPDDQMDIPLASEADLDDEMLLEDGDDIQGPRKRRATPFDPHKPVRVWVIETYVKAGVPLKVEDWEAERQRPMRSKRTVPASCTDTVANKSVHSRRTKAAASVQQAPIQNFAKVTKPGRRTARVENKPQNTVVSYPATMEDQAVVNLLSSSPSKTDPSGSLRSIHERSLSPLLELPPSVTKRTRAPTQRAHTVSSSTAIAPEREVDLPASVIETLDLVNVSPVASPLHAPATRPRTQARKKPVKPGSVRSTNTYTTKTSQTTLDRWASTGSSPKKPSCFEMAEENVATLDLTLSSPLAPRLEAATSPCKHREDSHSSLLTTSSSSGAESSKVSSAIASDMLPMPGAMIAARSQQNFLQPTSKFGSLEMDSLDLTGPSLLQPALEGASSPLLKNLDPPRQGSPLIHTSTSSPSAKRMNLPSAAWKVQEKKKREVVLRKSLAGAWAIVDAQVPMKTGKEESRAGRVGGRRRWRESEIEFLDLCS